MWETTFWDDFFSLLIGAVPAMAAVMIITPRIQQAMVVAQQRVPVLAEAPDAVAGNEGFMWLQLTPLGQPSMLKIIAENRTGAFEQVLISLTT